MTDYIREDIETDNMADALVAARLASRRESFTDTEPPPMTSAEVMRIINEISRDIESRDTE